MTPGLIVLAGTSESGKSSAGRYFSQRHNARRIKIRTILTDLASGRPAIHEGAPTREGFDRQEFLALVQRLRHTPDSHAVVIESFIDAELAAATRQAWIGPSRIVFITAARSNRIARLVASVGITPADAAAAIDRKDARKRVVEQWQQWGSLADDWIDNDASYASFLTALDAVWIKLKPATPEIG